MTTTNVTQNIVQTVTIGTLAATLTTSSYYNPGTTGLINNVATIGTLASGDLVDFFINTGTNAVTCGASGTPTMTVALLDTQDGTNYVSPGTSAAAAPAYLTTSVPLPNSFVFTEIVLPDVPIRPYKTIPDFQNNTGATLPVGTVIVAVVKNIENY